MLACLPAQAPPHGPQAAACAIGPLDILASVLLGETSSSVLACEDLMFLGAGQLWDTKMCRQDWVQWRKWDPSMGAGCGASVSLEISDHWSGMLDLDQRDSQGATGDCGLGVCSLVTSA